MAELAGLLKEMAAATLALVESEQEEEAERLARLAREVAGAGTALAERCKKLATNAKSLPATPVAAPVAPVASNNNNYDVDSLEAACASLASAASRGPDAARAALREAQGLAMGRLRAGKEAGERGGAGEGWEEELGRAAEGLRETVRAVREFAQTGGEKEQRRVEETAMELAKLCKPLAGTERKSGTSFSSSSSSPLSLPAPSPRGASLSMEQLMALAAASNSKSTTNNSNNAAVEVETSAPAPVRRAESAAKMIAKEQHVAVEEDGAEEERLERAATSLRDPAHRLLACALREAAGELAAWQRGGGEGGEEEGNRLARGALCSALAQILAHRFRVGRAWLGAWGGPSHFWHFVMDFATNSSVNTIAGLSLQKCLKQVAADERAGHDENSRFRSFVVAALNQGKLARWLAEISDAGHAAAVARCYEPGAMMLDAEARAAMMTLLKPLERGKWNLDLHYETVLRERKKAVQMQQQQQQH